MIHLATQQGLTAFAKIKFQRRKPSIQSHPHPQTHGICPTNAYRQYGKDVPGLARHASLHGDGLGFN